MEIRLSPELAAMVEGDVASGRFSSVDQYIAEAVEQLHERAQWRYETLDEQREKLEEAWQQAERGELISIEEVRERMKAMKAEWSVRQQTV